MNLDAHLAKIPDFPQPGILFYDISPVMEDASLSKQVIQSLADLAKPYEPDVVVGLDARGFLFSVPVGHALNLGSVMIRKAGKLPGDVIEQPYDLEYGQAILAVQTQRQLEGKKVLLVDDLLATGGTAAAAQQLLTKVGATVVASLFVIELKGLKGRAKLSGPVHALQSYEF